MFSLACHLLYFTGRSYKPAQWAATYYSHGATFFSVMLRQRHNVSLEDQTLEESHTPRDTVKSNLFCPGAKSVSLFGITRAYVVWAEAVPICFVSPLLGWMREHKIHNWRVCRANSWGDICLSNAHVLSEPWSKPFFVFCSSLPIN